MNIGNKIFRWLKPENSKPLIIIFAIICTCFPINSQETKKQNVRKETQLIEPMQYDVVTFKKFDDDPFYSYQDRIPLMKRLYMWIDQLRMRMFGKVVTAEQFWLIGKILGIVFVILIIGIILKKRNILFNRRNTKLDYYIENEDIENENFDKLLQKAITACLWAEAIRWQFMKTLQNMQKRNLISFDDYKTVNEYVYEINDATLKSIFKTLAYSFVYYRYGDGEADESTFEKFKTLSETIIV